MIKKSTFLQLNQDHQNYYYIKENFVYKIATLIRKDSTYYVDLKFSTKSQPLITRTEK